MTQVPKPFTRQDVSIETSKDSYSGFFRIRTYELQHALFKGGHSHLLKRELFERGEAVAVLLFDPDQQEVVLTEQFRIGALDDERSPWLLELVAGMIESGESPESVAERETLEEAGCRYAELVPICRYWVSPGGTNERIHLYCGLLDSSGVDGIHGLDDEGEDIRLVKLPLNEAFKLLDQGVINNAATIIALQWLQLNLDRFIRDSAGSQTTGTES
ncbi:MAG: ADP-ribose diphosphatase [Oceanospirillaceae bacterium]|nr:ADP-ribose diphosphatase [Oceanospirillaceae bacterium]|tara:strand:+ start:718 stop:1365 length:648 start_codon:yes stop_codon:yes gene_type:complete